jgi:predicted transcriptional regulator
VGSLLSTTSPYKLSKAEKAAIDEALEASKDGQRYTREEVMKKARQKYPDLNFR